MPRNIAVVGPRSAGKTVHFATLCYAIAHQHGPALDACMRLHHVESRSATGGQALGDMIRALRAEVPWPSKTIERVDHTLRVWARVGRARREACYQIDWTDMPGESYEGVAIREDAEPVLQNASGLYCFIDPTIDPKALPALVEAYSLVDGKPVPTGQTTPRPVYHDLPAFYGEMLYSLVNTLIAGDAQGRVTIPVAFVITKVDHNEELWNMRNRPEDLLEMTVGAGGVGLIKEVFTKRQVYGSTSVGTILDGNDRYIGSNLQTNPHKGLIRYSKWHLPLNIVEPLAYILGHI